jgi:hypothetical protein
MGDEERNELISDIEEITSRVEKLEPQVYEEEARAGTQSQSINRSRLMELRNELAEKTERLNKLEKITRPDDLIPGGK